VVFVSDRCALIPPSGCYRGMVSASADIARVRRSHAPPRPTVSGMCSKVVRTFSVAVLVLGLNLSRTYTLHWPRKSQASLEMVGFLVNVLVLVRAGSDFYQWPGVPHPAVHQLSKARLRGL
jgi:hypothetical protein